MSNPTQANPIPMEIDDEMRERIHKTQSLLDNVKYDGSSSHSYPDNARDELIWLYKQPLFNAIKTAKRDNPEVRAEQVHRANLIARRYMALPLPMLPLVKIIKNVELINMINDEWLRGPATGKEPVAITSPINLMPLEEQYIVLKSFLGSLSGFDRTTKRKIVDQDSIIHGELYKWFQGHEQKIIDSFKPLVVNGQLNQMLYDIIKHDTVTGMVTNEVECLVKNHVVCSTVYLLASCLIVCNRICELLIIDNQDSRPVYNFVGYQRSPFPITREKMDEFVNELNLFSRMLYTSLVHGAADRPSGHEAFTADRMFEDLEHKTLPPKRWVFMCCGGIRSPEDVYTSMIKEHVDNPKIIAGIIPHKYLMAQYMLFCLNVDSVLTNWTSMLTAMARCGRTLHDGLTSYTGPAWDKTVHTVKQTIKYLVRVAYLSFYASCLADHNCSGLSIRDKTYHKTLRRESIFSPYVYNVMAETAPEFFTRKKWVGDRPACVTRTKELARTLSPNLCPQLLRLSRIVLLAIAKL